MTKLIPSLLFCLCVAVGRAEEKLINPLLLSLKEAVFTHLLESHPPKDLFTVAMEYDLKGKVFESPSKEFVTKMLAIEGVKADLFVPRHQLVIPDFDKMIRMPNGTSRFQGVLKRGTTRSVDVYEIDSVEWRSDDEAVVKWSVGSGPLSGGRGSSLYYHTKDGWKFAEDLEHWVS
ncbi:MAG: hypothetical protein ABIS50_00125 [Luteolibacter sp.]|uniref:hypothetical protein n=1 Tax=Luteolibacter sp. TaxID=1962973 RepID=UPI00326571F2